MINLRRSVLIVVLLVLALTCTVGLAAEQKVLDLKIGDYLVDVEPTEHMDYQQALVVAMKKKS